MRGRLLAHVVLILATLLAWLPSLGPYVPIADDFSLGAVIENGLYAYYRSWLPREGIWRIAGMPLIGLAIKPHPLFYGFLALSIHIVAVASFFRVSELLLGSRAVALVLALTAAIYPFGHAAILLAAGYQVVVATALFWATYLLLLTTGCTSRQGVVFVASFVLTLLAALIHEILTFAFMASGLVLWLSGARPHLAGALRLMKARWAGWAPLLAGVAYIGLFEALRPPGSWKTPTWNPESLVSVTYHQYSNVYVFQPWFDPATRHLTFYGWSAITVVAAAVIAAALGIALCVFLRSGAAAERPPATGPVFVHIVLLLLGASFVYAVGGGYSLDSRKKYALIPVFLLVAGWLWRRLVTRPVRVRWQAAALAAFLACGVVSSWLVIGIWRYEARRGAALTDFLVANQIAGDIRVEWRPDLYRAWPTMRLVWGYRMDDEWLLNVALQFKGGRPVRVGADPNAPLLRVGADSTVSLVAPDR